MTHIDIYGSVIPLLPKRRRRRTKPKPEIPVMTSGLETKLNNALKCNADQVINYLTYKFGKPTRNDRDGYYTLKFGGTPTTYRRVAPLAQADILDYNIENCLTIHMDRRTIYFLINLSIKADTNTLEEYDFRMGACSR
jgi:hypothetical protein